MTDRTTAQEVADDMLTDPDQDAAHPPASPPPQTVDAEPATERRDGAGAARQALTSGRSTVRAD